MIDTRRAATFLAIALWLAAPRAEAWDEAVVLCTDYTGPGSVRSFQRSSPWSVSPDLATVGVDPVARWRDGLLWVVNRAGGGNVQVLDPADGWRTVRQFSVGAGRNPQDIAFAPDGAAYVSCYDEAVLLRVDPVTGAVLEEISTSDFADADGLPETGWMEVVGWRLHVTAQRLDRDNWYTPAGPGLLLVYDMQARAWIDADPALAGVQGIALQGANPWCQPELAPGGQLLRLGCAGWYGLADGGVEEIDLVALRSLGWLVTEAALAGDLLDFTLAGEDRAFAIVSDAAFHTAVKMWRPADGAVLATLKASDAYSYPDLAWDGRDWLYIADRTPGASGLWILAAATGSEQVAAPIPTGLAPVRLVLPRDPALTAVPAVAPRAAIALAPPCPNPANPAATLRMSGPAGGRLDLRVEDLRGRRVRGATIGLDEGGEGSFLFDGLDARGRPVASGCYLVIVEGAGSAARASLTVVR